MRLSIPLTMMMSMFLVAGSSVAVIEAVGGYAMLAEETVDAALVFGSQAVAGIEGDAQVLAASAQGAAEDPEAFAGAMSDDAQAQAAEVAAAVDESTNAALAAAEDPDALQADVEAKAAMLGAAAEALAGNGAGQAHAASALAISIVEDLASSAGSVVALEAEVVLGAKDVAMGAADGFQSLEPPAACNEHLLAFDGGDALGAFLGAQVTSAFAYQHGIGHSGPFSASRAFGEATFANLHAFSMGMPQDPGAFEPGAFYASATGPADAAFVCYYGWTEGPGYAAVIGPVYAASDVVDALIEA